MVMYSFRLENFEKWLADFAAKLNTSVKDNLVSLPAHLGKGTILRHRTINEHLSYAIMNFTLDTDLELFREKGETRGFSLSFNQVEMQKELQVGYRQHIITDKRPFRNDIFLTDTRDSLYLRIPAGSAVKRLLILCDPCHRSAIPAAGNTGQTGILCQGEQPYRQSLFRQPPPPGDPQRGLRAARERSAEPDPETGAYHPPDREIPAFLPSPGTGRPAQGC